MFDNLSDFETFLSLIVTFITIALTLANYLVPYFKSLFRFKEYDKGNPIPRLTYDLRPYDDAGKISLSALALLILCIIVILINPTPWTSIIFGILVLVIFSSIVCSGIISIQYKDELIVTKDDEGNFFVVNFLVDDKYIVRKVDGKSQNKVMSIDEIIDDFVGYQSKKILKS